MKTKKNLMEEMENGNAFRIHFSDNIELIRELDGGDMYVLADADKVFGGRMYIVDSFASVWADEDSYLVALTEGELGKRTFTLPFRSWIE